MLIEYLSTQVMNYYILVLSNKIGKKQRLAARICQIYRFNDIKLLILFALLLNNTMNNIGKKILGFIAN